MALRRNATPDTFKCPECRQPIKRTIPLFFEMLPGVAEDQSTDSVIGAAWHVETSSCIASAPETADLALLRYQDARIGDLERQAELSEARVATLERENRKLQGDREENARLIRRTGQLERENARMEAREAELLLQIAKVQQSANAAAAQCAALKTEVAGLQALQIANETRRLMEEIDAHQTDAYYMRLARDETVSRPELIALLQGLDAQCRLLKRTEATLLASNQQLLVRNEQLERRLLRLTKERRGREPPVKVANADVGRVEIGHDENETRNERMPPVRATTSSLLVPKPAGNIQSTTRVSNGRGGRTKQFTFASGHTVLFD